MLTSAFRFFAKYAEGKVPLILKQKLQNELQLGVWEITESDSFFEECLSGTTIDQSLKGRRRTEWLASRVLISEMLGDRVDALGIAKDEYGKPYFKDSPIRLSLSHTRRFAAAILGPSEVGIDIQVPVTKIYRIAHKFLSEDELDTQDPLTLEELHVYWGAKESMYKIYGRRKVDFRSNLMVSPIDHEKSQLQGQIMMPDYQSEVSLYFYLCSDFILVYGWPPASAGIL